MKEQQQQNLVNKAKGIGRRACLFIDGGKKQSKKQCLHSRVVGATRKMSRCVNYDRFFRSVLGSERKEETRHSVLCPSNFRAGKLCYFVKG